MTSTERHITTTARTVGPSSVLHAERMPTMMNTWHLFVKMDVRPVNRTTRLAW